MNTEDKIIYMINAYKQAMKSTQESMDYYKGRVGEYQERIDKLEIRLKNEKL